MKVMCLKGVDIEDLINVLMNQFADHFNGVWDYAGGVLGVFVHETMGFGVTTVVHYETKSDSCEVTVASAGRREGLFGGEAHLPAEERLMDLLTEVVVSKGWQKVVKEGKGSTWADCPHCKAGYFYAAIHILPDHTVACQNCNRQFKIEEARVQTL